MKTSELIGPALDYSVAKCEGYILYSNAGKICCAKDGDEGFLTKYSTDWSQGGPLIAKEKISIISQEPPFELWRATNGTRVCEEAYSFEINNEVTEEGPTPLIAAMRCLVASKLGDEVEIPEELCK